MGVLGQPGATSRRGGAVASGMVHATTLVSQLGATGGGCS